VDTRFGPFTLLRPLGQGASGRVDAALDASGALVALKRVALASLRDTAPSSEAAIEQFGKQAQALMQLRHAAVAATLAHGVDASGEMLWLAMELAPGHSLEHHTNARHLLPPAMVLRIGAQLSEALAAAHALGLIHRDLKAANVRLLLPAGSVKLLDFGLARQLDDMAQTATGVVMGTPECMAPELLAGARASPASDVYALGVLLYQLLTGHLPFEGHAQLASLLRAVAHEAPAPLAQWLGTGGPTEAQALPAGLQSLLDALLAKRASERPAAGAALSQRLQELAAACGEGDQAES
jgi:serine/threonine protein kinase